MTTLISRLEAIFDYDEIEEDVESGAIASVLDDAVHHKKSEEATSLNNQGIDAQLNYLTETQVTNGTDVWSVNCVQFPRLLVEIQAIGLTPEQLREISESSGLCLTRIREIFESADEVFERDKRLLND